MSRIRYSNSSFELRHSLDIRHSSFGLYQACPPPARQALLQMLHDAGVRYIFGNPGTTELPLVDALALDKRFQYILGLQEVPVMAMADGYSMASRSLGVVNLHISCGLGNAMGMLYNAYPRRHSLVGHGRPD